MDADGARVLVVDDDAAVAALAATIAADAGHTVTVAGSVEEALALAGAQRFDVVVTDVVLGARDGLDLAEALSAIQPAIRFVFMSGYGTLGVRSPEDPVLMKPFHPHELRDRVAAAL
jgi:DNA-binding response OmpR family regulator